MWKRPTAVRWSGGVRFSPVWAEFAVTVSKNGAWKGAVDQLELLS